MSFYACISNVDETSLLTDADLVQLQALEIDPFDLQNHIKLGSCITSMLVFVRDADALRSSGRQLQPQTAPSIPQVLPVQVVLRELGFSLVGNELEALFTSLSKLAEDL